MSLLKRLSDYPDTPCIDDVGATSQESSIQYSVILFEHGMQHISLGLSIWLHVCSGKMAPHFDLLADSCVGKQIASAFMCPIRPPHKFHSPSPPQSRTSLKEVAQHQQQTETRYHRYPHREAPHLSRRHRWLR